MSDLRDTFELYERALNETAILQGVIPPDDEPTDEVIESGFGRHRDLLAFLAELPDSRWWLCKDGSRIVGHARVVRLGEMEELTEIMVVRDCRGRGIGRQLLSRCWPGEARRDLPRLVVAAGAPADLSLYSGFGLMPVAGHWDLRVKTHTFRKARDSEGNAEKPPLEELDAAEARNAWARLEAAALGYARTPLHQHFAKSRTCLARPSGDKEPVAVCWLSDHGEVGPAAGDTPADLATIVVGALDRLAESSRHEELAVYVTTASPALYPRFSRLGFRVYWPSWIMASAPLPSLDRYIPTRPPYVL